MLNVYNTLSRKKEIFRPKQGNKVELFVCGPTTYDFSHIGHARTYIAFDAIVKYLRRLGGYDVFYLQNITDIDDKIINRARQEKTPWKTLARKFEKEYFADMKALKVNAVNKYARATAHIKEIISQVERLLKKGFAYKIEDGIYYDVVKFKDYGKLSKRTALQAEDAVTRIDESKEKRNRGDFCLWKFSKAGEPKWQSPFGLGRPGWHIEDTAITEKFFGPQYDVHGGAKDLIFPHHEAEISQMEAISGKEPLVRYWFHTGFLTVGGEKMAKSLGNFITIREFLQKYPARLLRFFVLKAHYRSPINYTEKAILQAEKELGRIDEFINKIKNLKLKIKNYNSKFKIKKHKDDFELAFEDDFNTPEALAALFGLVNEGNSLMAQDKLTPADAKEISVFLNEIDKFLGFVFWKKPKETIPNEILALVKERENARENGDFKKADDIRNELKMMGYWVEDTKEGTKIKKA